MGDLNENAAAEYTGQLRSYDKSGTQAFFAALATEARRPHFGDQAKEWTRALLLRAEEAGLYQPETK